MRVAFVSPFGFSPKATLSHRLLPLAGALKRKGHEVMVAVPPYTNPSDSGRSMDSDEVKVINIELPGKIFYELRIGLRLAGQIVRFNPERVYIFKPKGYSALAGMLLRLMGKFYPFYLDIDDLETDRDMEKRMRYPWWMRIIFRFQERYLLKTAVMVTTASRYLQEYYILRAGKKRVYYLPNGPAAVGGLEDKGSCISAEDLKKKMGLQGKRIVLLYTRFTECHLKDIVDFVRMFSRQFSEGLLLIVGEAYGREREELSRLLKEKNLAEFVVFTGWVKRAELRDYLSLGEVAIYPLANTPFNQAKCSAKLIELLSLAKPVVASPVGEVLTYIRDGETGFLAGDMEEMADKVRRLLEDRGKACALGQGARNFLYDNFNWDKLVDIILSADVKPFGHCS